MSSDATRPTKHDGPYREGERGLVCPRCTGALRELAVEGALVLDCAACGGVFVGNDVLAKLESPEGHALRVAFPERPRTPESGAVHYLKCPRCSQLMNRTDFVRGSGIVVDVCKSDGVWFDAGEVNAVIALVERGDVARARRDKVREASDEKQRLQAEWRREHAAAEAETLRGRQRVHLSEGERTMLDALGRWLRK
ncbi:MAG: zf-TFIIB domain-containing protein [Polyangiaceae bacterium]